MNHQRAHDLSSIQEILKPCIWFSGCAITRISSTWLWWGNLASAAVWRDLQILKNLQKPSWCQEGMERVCCLGGVWFRLAALCVHLSTFHKTICALHTGDDLWFVPLPTEIFIFFWFLFALCRFVDEKKSYSKRKSQLEPYEVRQSWEWQQKGKRFTVDPLRSPVYG